MQESKTIKENTRNYFQETPYLFNFDRIYFKFLNNSRQIRKFPLLTFRRYDANFLWNSVNKNQNAKK